MINKILSLVFLCAIHVVSAQDTSTKSYFAQANIEVPTEIALQDLQQELQLLSTIKMVRVSFIEKRIIVINKL